MKKHLLISVDSGSLSFSSMITLSYNKVVPVGSIPQSAFSKRMMNPSWATERKINHSGCNVSRALVHIPQQFL